MIENFIGDATQRMDKSVDATHEHFNSVRTGRATPALLDRITGGVPAEPPAGGLPDANTLVFSPTLVCRESTHRYQP